MTYPILPEPLFWAAVIGRNRQTLFSLNNSVQYRRLTGCSSIAAAAAAAAAASWTHEGTYLIYGSLASISLRPRDPS